VDLQKGRLKRLLLRDDGFKILAAGTLFTIKNQLMREEKVMFQRGYFYICHFLIVFALTSAATAANAATCCVWRVANASAPCYLVGTIHALSGNDYRLPEGYYQALRDSKRLVFEVNPELKDNFNQKFGRASAYPKGDDIRRHVHPKTWQILELNFKNASLFGRSMKVGGYYLEYGMQQLRPWAIAQIFYGVPGYNDIHDYFGVDNYFTRQARHSGKELAGLETVDEHIEVLHGMNDVESEITLLETIVFRDKQRDEYNELRAAWRRGDTAIMWALNQRDRNLNPGANVRLLDMRNVKWVPKIRAEFNSGKPTAIVVGADHMLGPNGLIPLLRRNGYKFEQL
jgi:uncharacterized protein